MKKNLVGLIGWPVAHSLSAIMHSAAFDYLGMKEWEYQTIPVSPENLEKELQRLIYEGYRGINITIPYKSVIMPFVKPEQEALRIGAINTLLLPDLKGFNTDKAGFIEDIQAEGVSLKGKKSLVLGAGGAARAAIYGLIEAQSHVMIWARNPAKVHLVLQDMRLKAEIIENTESLPYKEIDIIINCTPLGMWPESDKSPWPENIEFPDNILAYDMVYRPMDTKFLQRARENGCKAKSGIGMLLLQGVKAFELWTGQKAPWEIMEKALKEALI